MTQPKKDIPARKPGRPKGALGKIAEVRRMTVRELMAQHVSKVVKTWVEILEDKNAAPAARIAAGNSIMDRAIGRPAQAEPTADDTPDKKISRIEIVVVDVPERKPSKGKADA